MGNITAYSAINAKVKGMVGKLLSNDDFENLLDLDSIEAVAAYLKSTDDYKDLFEDRDISGIKRGELEDILKKDMIKDYIKIVRFLKGSHKDFFKLLFLRFEIEDIKILLRRAQGRTEDDVVEQSLIYLGTYSTVDMSKIKEHKSVGELVDALKGSVYYEIMQQMLGIYYETKNLFDIEMALDLAYFKMLVNKVKKLTASDSKVIMYHLGFQIDFLNLQWIYRSKSLKGMEPESVLNYTIPYYFKIDLEFLKKLCKADKEEFLDMLRETAYYDIFYEGHDIIFMERRFLKLQWKRYRFSFINSAFNIGAVISYIHLKEYEIRDLITVIEVIRYGINKNEGVKYLIREMGGK